MEIMVQEGIVERARKNAKRGLGSKQSGAIKSPGKLDKETKEDPEDREEEKQETGPSKEPCGVCVCVCVCVCWTGGVGRRSATWGQ
jgi:hypothetical protein